MDKTCVLVSPYFPPSTLAGVHRARHLAKHLPSAGWKAIVLCVDEAYHEQLLDPGLASLLPDTVEVIKVAALSARYTRPLGVGEISLRAFLSLRSRLFHLLEVRSIDAVMITGSPYYPMLFAADIKKRYGVPVVLDFQDPWVSGWGASQPRLSKAGLSHALATHLEPKALRGASYVTSVSETQNLQLAALYPWFDATRMAAIPIGCDPEDFTVVRDTPASERGVQLDKNYINLSFVGTIMPRTLPLIEIFLEGLAKLRSGHPELAKRLRINFIGTSNQPNDFDSFRVTQLAEVAAVQDMIKEIPQRIPYLDALRVLALSDGTLMIGSDEPHYTASKIYPGLMSGRPFISLFHRASSAHEILSAAGSGIALAFSNQSQLEDLAAGVSDALNVLVTTPESLGQSDPTLYAPYDAHQIAERFANIFDSLEARNA